MQATYRHGTRLGWVEVILAGCLISGCASMGIRTQGAIQGIHWHTQDYQNYTLATQEREVYEYTLVLDETEGREVTFTQLQARIRNNPHSWGVEWEKTGRWHLEARGTLEIDLGSWRYCMAVNCRDWGPFAPAWDLTLIGTDAQGQPVRRVIQMRLPYADQTHARWQSRL